MSEIPLITLVTALMNPSGTCVSMNDLNASPALFAHSLISFQCVTIAPSARPTSRSGAFSARNARKMPPRTSAAVWNPSLSVSVLKSLKNSPTCSSGPASLSIRSSTVSTTDFAPLYAAVPMLPMMEKMSSTIWKPSPGSSPLLHLSSASMTLIAPSKALPARLPTPAAIIPKRMVTVSSLRKPDSFSITGISASRNGLPTVADRLVNAVFRLPMTFSHSWPSRAACPTTSVWL